MARPASRKGATRAARGREGQKVARELSDNDALLGRGTREILLKKATTSFLLICAVITHPRAAPRRRHAFSKGLRPSQRAGSNRLRELATSRKQEHLSTSSCNDKAVIARETYEEITARGGRFLKQASSGGSAARSKREGGAFAEAPRKVGEERRKQILREKCKDKQADSSEGENCDGEHASGELDESVLTKATASKLKTRRKRGF